jgi:hypothetical protein
MNDTEFDGALIAAFFRLAAEKGWRGTTVAEAARAGAVSLAEARARFPGRAAVLLRFGRMADQAALAETPADGSVRDKLFALLMRRFDALQTHRAGVAALLRALPSEPPMALLLACATRRSMRWMLAAAGVSTAGLRGELRVRGLVTVWAWTLRAWARDGSADLSGTMAALDAALRRAEQVAAWLGGDGTGTAEPAEDGSPEPDAPEPEAPAVEPGAKPDDPLPPAGPLPETPPA